MQVVRRLSLCHRRTLGRGGLARCRELAADVSPNAARSLAAATHSSIRPSCWRAPRVRAACAATSSRSRSATSSGCVSGSAARSVWSTKRWSIRVSSTLQNRVAWALLGRLRRGDAYVVDPSSLEGLGPWTPAATARPARRTSHSSNGRRAASDPRAGELAVRLAYSIEAAKGTHLSSAVPSRRRRAALVRDRALALRRARPPRDASEQHEER